ncbi:MAG: hypothetical protein EXS09_06035 [Gemmataceae bacterium]|nr:hypothetical protein [Gemmataceae bacterium]
MLPRLSIVLSLLVTGLAFTQEPMPTVTDSAGKELTLKKWKIVAGTRKLSWAEGKPESFEIREVGSTSFKDGIITFVAMSRVQEVTWDYEKETMTVRVAGLEKPLIGTTKYKDINVLTIEAEVDQGKSGVADLRFRGGPIKGGIRGIKFPNAKAPEKMPEAGPAFAFTVPPEAKSKGGPAVYQASGFQALYRTSNTEEKLLPYLMFKKTLKVEIANIGRLTVGAYNAKDHTAECELKQKDGMDLSVSLPASFPIDGKPATLLGFVGTVPAGYRLFPIHTISQFEPVVEKK